MHAEPPAGPPLGHVRERLAALSRRLVSPRAAPRLGADTEDVLVRVLGLGRVEVAELVAERVCP